MTDHRDWGDIIFDSICDAIRKEATALARDGVNKELVKRESELRARIEEAMGMEIGKARANASVQIEQNSHSYLQEALRKAMTEATRAHKITIPDSMLQPLVEKHVAEWVDHDARGWVTSALASLVGNKDVREEIAKKAIQIMFPTEDAFVTLLTTNVSFTDLVKEQVRKFLAQRTIRLPDFKKKGRTK